MELKELIEMMSGAKDGNEPIGSKTLSWKAYRTAEELNNTDLIPKLKVYIKDENHEATRKYAYDLLGYIGINANASEVTNILIDQIKVEDNNNDNLHNVLDVLYTTNFPLQKGLDEMLIYAFDDRELIRTTAIQLLSKYTIEHQKIKDTLLEVVKYHYDEYDLKYAIESLQVLFPDDYKEWVFRIKEDLLSNNGDKILIDRINNTIRN